jgi:hypothetical protein
LHVLIGWGRPLLDKIPIGVGFPKRQQPVDLFKARNAESSSILISSDASVLKRLFGILPSWQRPPPWLLDASPEAARS